MGGDFGQWNEWDFDNSLQWDLMQWESHQGLARCVADLNRLYRSQPSLYQLDFDWQGFEWIDCPNFDVSVLSYLRRAQDPRDFLVVVCNFTPVPRFDYRLGVPEAGWYDEVFNSDSTYYGGSNLGNGPGLQAKEVPCHERPASIELTLPPLATVILKPRR